MKCPNCGSEVKGSVCKYCHTEFPFNEHDVLLKRFTIKIISIVNQVLFPPAKVMFVFWTLCWVYECLNDNTISSAEKICAILFGYIFLCGIADLIYLRNKKRYLAYKLKITQKEMARIKKLMDKYYPYKGLLDEANNLANIANTTTDKETFERSYDRLIEIFTELKKYEYLGAFTNSPTEDLNDLIYGREAATKRFYERSNKKTNSLHDNAAASSTVSASNNMPYPDVAQIEHKSIVFQSPANADPYFIDAAKYIIEKDKGSIGMLQRYFNIGFNRAAHIMDQLEEAGIVAPENGTFPRRVLMNLEQFEQYLNNGCIHLSYNKHTASSVLPNTNERIALYNNQYDCMEGHDFEYFCAEILKKNGFSNVEVTQGSGDHGIDILADKDDVSYAIQCKCYSSNIGNSAVQQAHSGKGYYNKDIAVVLTNRYFTAQAIEEANANSVKLWDRDRLNQMIEQSE